MHIIIHLTCDCIFDYEHRNIVFAFALDYTVIDEIIHLLFEMMVWYVRTMFFFTQYNFTYIYYNITKWNMLIWVGIWKGDEAMIYEGFVVHRYKLCIIVSSLHFHVIFINSNICFVNDIMWIILDICCESHLTNSIL